MVNNYVNQSSNNQWRGVSPSGGPASRERDEGSTSLLIKKRRQGETSSNVMLSTAEERSGPGAQPVASSGVNAT